MQGKLIHPLAGYVRGASVTNIQGVKKVQYSSRWLLHTYLDLSILSGIPARIDLCHTEPNFQAKLRWSLHFAVV